MASSLDDTNEWELSKENIQPLRQGRKFSSLTAALQPHSVDQQKIKQQKDLFERQLRTYEGDDPLEVWYQYIKWTEQAYPKGGKDGNLKTLLERCITKFKDYEEYKNDPRNTEAWIKFANLCNDPIEIFIFMFDQGLGCQQAMLYEAWAWSLELIGNKKKADLVFLEGIKRGAEPAEVLAYKHQEFQARTVKEMMKGGNSDDEDMSEEQRTVLGQLRTSGKHRSVGTARTGAVKKALHAGGLTLPTQSSANPQVAQPFEVFTDDNHLGGVPIQTGEWTTLPKCSQTNRENEKKPGPWNKVKFPQKSRVVPSSSAVHLPEFTVHEDTHPDQHSAMQHKLPEWNDGVLSAKKAEKPPLHHIQQAAGQLASDVSQHPMYCKHKIYTGLAEFSFEEIRAAHVLAKKKKKEEELRLLEEKRLIEEQRLQLLREREELANQQEQIRHRMDEMDQLRQNLITQQSQQQQQQQQQHITNEWEANAAEQRAEIERSFQQLSVAGFDSSSSQSRADTHDRANCQLTKKLNFDDLTLPGPVPADLVHGCTAPVNLNESVTSSERTPSVTLPLNTTHSSGSLTRSPYSDSFHKARGTLTAPSPTVCTLEAISAVQGMFNSSLESDRRMMEASSTTDLKELETLSTHRHGEVISDQAIPFTIYSSDEPTGGLAPGPIQVYSDEAANSLGTGPIQVYCDDQENKENCLVSRLASNASTKRKALAGILQPSQGVPVDPAGDGNFTADVRELQIKSGEEMEMERIEQHALDDHTIAAVGSSESFSAAAKFASTPYNLTGKLGDQSSSASQSHLSHLSHITSKSTHTSDITQSSNVTHMSSVTQPQNFDMTTLSKKGLSPIFEGLSEGSSEEWKSHASSLTSHSVGVSQLHQGQSLLGEREVIQTGHCIDMTTYVVPKPDEHTEALLNMSVRIDPSNPFDEETVARFLQSLITPLTQYPNYVAVDSAMPRFVLPLFDYLGQETYQVHRCIAEGGFGKIYYAEEFSMDPMLESPPIQVVIKVQQPACPWEFYICSEIADRLKRLQLPMDIRPSVMSISKGYFYQDGSCLVSEYHKHGSLLNLVNQYARNKDWMAGFEPFVLYLTIELLHIIENLHRCHIIHGDIKPDNILIVDIPLHLAGRTRRELFGTRTKCLKLIDFGRSIDMTLYPPNTFFTTQSNTSGFQCIEMKTNRPWTYQTDLFGLAGTVHVMVFGSYMKVYQEKGAWRMTSSFVRKWNVPLWKTFFDTLLNIPSCDDLPDLSKLRTDFEEYFLAEHIHKYNPIAERVLKQ